MLASVVAQCASLESYKDQIKHIVGEGVSEWSCKTKTQFINMSDHVAYKKWFVLIWSDFDSCDLCTNSWRHWHWQHQCLVLVSEWSLDYRLKKIYNLQIRILNLEPWMFSEFEFDCCETLRRVLQGCSRPGSPVLLVVCSREYLNPWTSNWNRRCGFSCFILTILLRTASHTRRAKLV
jgi:hypothetical protein